jgi:hypothetical protein
MLMTRRLAIRRVPAVLLLVAAFVATASAQETASSFDALSSDTLVLKGDGVGPFAVSDVRRIRARDRDSVKNGTLAGLVVGGGMATAWCVAAIADDSAGVDARVECAESFTGFPALGALAGLVVDARDSLEDARGVSGAAAERSA